MYRYIYFQNYLFHDKWFDSLFGVSIFDKKGTVAKLCWGALGSCSRPGALQDILPFWGKHSDICFSQHKLLLLSCLGLSVKLGGYLMKNSWDAKHWVNWKSLVTFGVKSIGTVNGETWVQFYQWLILYILGNYLMSLSFSVKIIIMRITNNKCKILCLIHGRC